MSKNPNQKSFWTPKQRKLQSERLSSYWDTQFDTPPYFLTRDFLKGCSVRMKAYWKAMTKEERAARGNAISNGIRVARPWTKGGLK